MSSDGKDGNRYEFSDGNNGAEESAGPFGVTDGTEPHHHDHHHDEVVLTPEAISQILHPSYLRKGGGESAERRISRKRHKSRGVGSITNKASELL
jgi:hypothetical protein